MFGTNHRPESRGGEETQEIRCYKKQLRGENKAIYPNILLKPFHCNKRWTPNLGLGVLGDKRAFVLQASDKWEDRGSWVFSGDLEQKLLYISTLYELLTWKVESICILWWIKCQHSIGKAKIFKGNDGGMYDPLKAREFKRDQKVTSLSSVSKAAWSYPKNLKFN